MRIDMRSSMLSFVASCAFLTLPAQALADNDKWERDDKCDVEDDADDEDYGNSLYDNQTYPWSAEQHQVSYDAEGAPGRTIRVLARLSDAPGQRPVVIVSHGGANGRTNPASALPRWSEYLAQHGFHVLSIAHAPRTDAEEQALCETFQLPEDEPCLAAHAWDRPYDVEQVLDFLDVQADGDWAGRVDMDRIAMLGHSAGASGALIVAGATRQVGVRLLDNDDDRIKVVVATSTGGILPGNGFDTKSWKKVEAPVLVLTGSADITNVAQPAGYRTDAFLGLNKNKKDNRLLFLDSAGATHSFFGFNVRECRNAVGDLACREMADAMQSVVLAHLDAYLSDDDVAQSWLEDEVIEGVVTPGLADLQDRKELIGPEDELEDGDED